MGVTASCPIPRLVLGRRPPRQRRCRASLAGRRQVASNAPMTHRSEQPSDEPARQLQPTGRGRDAARSGRRDWWLRGAYSACIGPHSSVDQSTRAISSSPTTTTCRPHRTEPNQAEDDELILPDLTAPRQGDGGPNGGSILRATSSSSHGFEPRSGQGTALLIAWLLIAWLLIAWLLIACHRMALHRHAGGNAHAAPPLRTAICKKWTKTILPTAFWSMFQPLIFHSTGTTATPTVSICLSS